MKRYNVPIIECTEAEMIRHLKRNSSLTKIIPYGVYDIAKKEIWIRRDLRDANVFTEVLIHEFIHFMQCRILDNGDITKKQSEEFAYTISRFYRKLIEQYRRKYNVYK